MVPQHSGTTKEEKKKIEDEKEAWRSVYAMFENERNDFIAELTEKQQLLNDTKKEMEEIRKELEDLKKQLRGDI